MKDCTGRVFVILPVHVVSNNLSPQLSTLLQTRMADYNVDISVVISSCDPLKTSCDPLKCNDHSSIVQEKCNSLLPLNWSVHFITQ